MIDIIINEETKIQGDKYQFMICKKYKDKKKGEVWYPKEFFPSLDYLIDHLVEEKLFLSDAKTFEQLLKNQEIIKKEILYAISNSKR